MKLFLEVVVQISVARRSAWGLRLESTSVTSTSTVLDETKILVRSEIEATSFGDSIIWKVVTGSKENVPALIRISSGKSYRKMQTRTRQKQSRIMPRLSWFRVNIPSIMTNTIHTVVSNSDSLASKDCGVSRIVSISERHRQLHVNLHKHGSQSMYNMTLTLIPVKGIVVDSFVTVKERVGKSLSRIVPYLSIFRVSAPVLVTDAISTSSSAELTLLDGPESSIRIPPNTGTAKAEAAKQRATRDGMIIVQQVWPVANSIRRADSLYCRKRLIVGVPSIQTCGDFISTRMGSLTWLVASRYRRKTHGQEVLQDIRIVLFRKNIDYATSQAFAV